MAGTTAQTFWKLVRRQHRVIARWQLLDLGFSAKAIEHRIAKGKLFPIHRGVYSVGTPNVSRLGRFMAAVLACEPRAVLSHDSAAALWGLLKKDPRLIEVSVPAPASARVSGIKVRRRAKLEPRDVARQHGIPVTSPVLTLIDMAARHQPRRIEAMVNEADALNVIRADVLREAIEEHPGRPGVPALRALLDRDTFVLTQSELERMFLPIARRAGLPKPRTQRHLGSHRVDFHFPELNLVVECDSLRYHRTPSRQAADTRRDHAHRRAGRESIRFTHHQIAREDEYVEAVLGDVVSLAA